MSLARRFLLVTSVRGLTDPCSRWGTKTRLLERLHKTMRKELFDGRRFSTIEHAQRELDAWVAHYNHMLGE